MSNVRRGTLCGIASLIFALAASDGWAADRAFDGSLAGLVDADGRKLPAQPYPGKQRLVLFGFTSCADVCPLTMLSIRRSLTLLGPRAAKVVPIFISVDPERDTPAKLKEYVRAFDPRIQGLTGTTDVLSRVAKGHGVFFEKRWINAGSGAYVFDHTATLLVVGEDGHLIASVSTTGAPADVAKNVAAALQ